MTIYKRAFSAKFPLPSTRMKAIVNRGNEATLERSWPIPKLRDDYVMVKPVTIALNPTDWRHLAGGRSVDGALTGCDFAGVVEEVGKAVTKPWRKGDRIFGVAHGSNLVNLDDGAFAEHIVVKGDLQMKIPEKLSFEKAATLGLGCITVGQGLYQKALRLALPTDPSKESEYVLIYGGSTATGALAIQYAQLSGYRVITTCSPKHFDYVKGLGAEVVFDYHNPTVGEDIRMLTKNQLKYAWDTISLDESAAICATALSTKPGARYGSLLSVKFPRDDVEATATVMFTVFGEAFIFGETKFPSNVEDFEFGKRFMSLTEDLLARGKLRTHTEIVGQRGLAGVVQGLRDLQAGKVSGAKLVYRVAETP